MPLRPEGRVSDPVAISWLDDLALRTTHLSLMTADPYAVADPLTAEPPGGVYARCRVSWRRSGRLLLNTNPLVWSGILQGVVIVAIAGWSSAFNGYVTHAAPFGPLDYSKTTSGGVIIEAEQYFVGLDR